MNTSNYDPKTKDLGYDNSTTFSNAKFGELVLDVNNLKDSINSLISSNNNTCSCTPSTVELFLASSYSGIADTVSTIADLFNEDLSADYTVNSSYRKIFVSYNNISVVELEATLLADKSSAKTLFAAFEMALPDSNTTLMLGFVIDVSSFSSTNFINLDSVPLYEFDYEHDEYKVSTDFSLNDIHISCHNVPLTTTVPISFSGSLIKISDINLSFPENIALYAIGSGSYSESGNPYTKYPTDPGTAPIINKANITYEFGAPSSIQSIGNNTTYTLLMAYYNIFYIQPQTNSTFIFNSSNCIHGLLHFFDLYLDCDASYTVTWPSSVKWNGGTSPTISAGMNVFSFFTLDAGTTWYASVKFAE